MGRLAWFCLARFALQWWHVYRPDLNRIRSVPLRRESQPPRR